MLRLRFSYNPNLYNRLIKLYTWYNYAHVDVEVSPGHYIGAIPGKGVIQHTSSPRDQKFMMLDVNRDLVVGFMQEQLGKEYDYWGIFGLAINANVDEKTKWFCSELVGEAIKFADKTKISIPSYKLTPRDIALICKDDTNV